jgi:hypothetical protein
MYTRAGPPEPAPCSIGPTTIRAPRCGILSVLARFRLPSRVPRPPKAGSTKEPGGLCIKGVDVINKNKVSPIHTSAVDASSAPSGLFQRFAEDMRLT